MARDKKTYEDDDGRTIANMDVEGMPWYSGGRRRREEGKEKTPLGPIERRATLVAVVCAALLIAAVFGVAYFLLILLMDRGMR